MKKLWLDLTTNVETGHYIALDVFKAVSFAVGICLTVGAQVYDRSVEPGVTLLLFAFGLQNSKLVSQYFQHKYTSRNDNALAALGVTKPSAGLPDSTL